MKIRSSAYALSTVDPRHAPERALPEIAMVGRSNVGKSSLINRLINRKNLARTSSEPGKTQTMNYYLINDEFYLVDLPGYGYAKVSQQMRERWKQWIFSYVRSGGRLKGVIQLVDVRHEPSVLDKEMYDWLQQCSVPSLLVATKLDKIKRCQYAKQEKLIRTGLEMFRDQPLIMFSALDGDGREEVLGFIEKCIDTD